MTYPSSDFYISHVVLPGNSGGTRFCSTDDLADAWVECRGDLLKFSKHVETMVLIRSTLTSPRTESHILLKKLVVALDSTYWSSWQTTAGFQKELDAARDHLTSAVQ